MKDLNMKWIISLILFILARSSIVVDVGERWNLKKTQQQQQQQQQQQ